MFTLSQIQAELERRALRKGAVEDLHDGQRRFIYASRNGSPSSFVALLSARRFGKTEGVLRYCGDLCLRKARSRCVGIYQQRVDARDIAWPLLIDLADRYKWNVRLNRIELGAIFENGSMIRLAGADDERRHRQFKGQRNDVVFIDEAQDWYSDVERLIQWLTPGVADRRGRIFLLGTPGVLPEGFFFDVVTEKYSQWHVVKGNPFENPYTRTELTDQLDTLRKTNPKIDETPWVQREYYGRWVIDRRKNVIHIEPALNYLYDWKPEDDDIYLISIDWGDRAGAFVVGTYNTRRYPWLVYLEAFCLQGLVLNEHLALIRQLEKKYPRSVIIADPGGISKALVRELREVHGIAIQNADKSNKLAQIELVNADLSLGTIKIFNRNDPDRPQDSLLAQQWRELVWIDDKLTGKRQEGRPRDIHDAALYLRRYAHKHLYKQPAPSQPSVGSEEWGALEAKKIYERKSKRFRQRRQMYGGYQ